MKEGKNIDRLYQENLKDFEVFPPNKAWNSIEKKLSASPKRKRFPIWVKVASIAAFLLLFFSISTIYLIPNNSFTKNFLPESLKNQEIIGEKDSLENTNTIPKRNKTEKKVSKTAIELTKENHITNITKEHTEEITEDNLEETTFNKKSLSKYSLTDAANLPLQNTKDNNDISKKETTNGKFTIATIFAPIYINSFGGGSGIDSQFKDNPTSGNSSYSYGVKFAYRLNNKFSLQSGVNLINLGYKTNNVYITPGVAVVGFSNLSNNPMVGKNDNISSSKNEILSSADDNKGSLNQVFGYIEIPIEIKYNVTDGKVGVNLVGGFSTLLLNKDEVFIETSDFTQSLGASNNLRSVNFSGNIGLDVDYLIKKNFYINVSPMFKIQTNTFSKNSGSIQPYYLGVYTGLNYKF